MSDVQFQCPHCQHQYVDKMEILDAGELHDLKCESCFKTFQVLIHDCGKCTAESVSVWGAPPTWEKVALFKCGSCGNSVNHIEAQEEEN